MNTFASVALTLAKMDLYVHPESDKFNTHGDKSPNIFLLCRMAGEENLDTSASVRGQKEKTGV